MPTQIQFRRDTASDWSSANPTLAAGEFGYESDTTKFKVGDGSTAWNSLAYNTSAGGTTINNATANELVTVASTTTQLDAESNLTFDGSTLAVTGAMTATTSIANDAISIDDNVIKGTRSNDDLFLEVSGTGSIGIKDRITDFSSNARWNHGVNIVHDGGTIDPNAMNSSSLRRYGNNRITKYTFNGTNSAQSNSRFRQGDIMHIDANGSSLTSTGIYRGPVANYNVVEIDNTSTTDVTIGNANGIFAEPYIYSDTSNAGNITLEALNTYVSVPFIQSADSNHTVQVSDLKHFRSQPADTTGAGTETVTTEYGFFMDSGSVATNKYLIYTNDDSYQSRVGTLENYREEVKSLSSSSTITVDCNQCPVFNVTLATNTQFVISNLATGQSVTLIITQDGTGSRTASFGTDGSTAVKFAGGTPTLSTAASAIDIVTIFNNGSSFFGNIAKAYA